MVANCCAGVMRMSPLMLEVAQEPIVERLSSTVRLYQVRSLTDALL